MRNRSQLVLPTELGVKIAEDDPIPDHSIIARFQNERLTNVIENLFYQLTEKLYKLGELSNKYIYFTRRSLEFNFLPYSANKKGGFFATLGSVCTCFPEMGAAPFATAPLVIWFR